MDPILTNAMEEVRRLYKAAPDLLAALEEMERTYSILGYGEHSEERIHIKARAAAAIAKAKGE